MLKPAVNSVLDEAHSRYSLVIAVAKRARRIAEQAERSGEVLVEKPVDIAVDELMHHRYKIVEPEEQENGQAGDEPAE